MKMIKRRQRKELAGECKQQKETENRRRSEK